MPFVKGQSGNPKGRKRTPIVLGRVDKAVTELHELAAAESLKPGQGPYDFLARLRDHEPACITELVWLATQRHNLPVKLAAINAVLDRTRGRPAVAVDVNAQVSGQVTLLAGLGVDDEATFEDALRAALDRKREQLADPAKTIDLEATETST